MSNAVATGWPSGTGNLGWGQEPTGMLMPGRVQGWPVGTQRAANPATQLLTQAVAYWDVANYRDGDRFLRNRGTGGDLLDLRLGSSIVANSNDPLFLPVADEGYVYLTGVAGNSLSVTAPATATNYIAYPLDRSASTATGAVTGGATFTFSTTGSWRLIELLDASNVVVDTIDCDAITTGSATSFTSGIVNQTVTINRSTSGRKSVAVPSRFKGGSPVMLLGTDDRLEIPVESGWQHTLLNFQQGDSFTVVAAIRPWASPGASRGIAVKADISTGGSGLVFSSTTNIGLWAPGNTSIPNAAANFGAVNVVAGSVDSAARIRRLTLGSTTDPRTYTWDPAMYNLWPWRIGRATNYGDFEFYAAAVFRRTLSAAEVTALSNYFTGRIA